VIAAAKAGLRVLGDVDVAVEERTLRWLRLTDSVDVDTNTFGRLIGAPTHEAQRIAEALVAHGVFERTEALICSNAECGVVLNDESLAESRCQTCGIDLTEYEPSREPRYRLEQPRSRDVGWLIALHGIRTHGVWQEQLQWLIDRQFRRTVPFRNWKYGRILFSALIPVLQRRLVRRFLIEVRTARAELENILSTGEAPPPDVIAHSFGTWIVAHALASDPTLRLGRLILVGSVIRPDWTWHEPLDRHQLTGVLNYCGDRDPWVGLSERFIPDSGPSGTIGFTEPHERLTNVLRPGGTHGSAFTRASFEQTFEDVWRPFLADRTSDVDALDHAVLHPGQWTRAATALRAPAPALLTLALLSAGIVALAIWG
jgi:pimeloyl-ACP methyl ester carboxylesterase